MLEVDGEIHTGRDWAAELGLGTNTINKYVRRYGFIDGIKTSGFILNKELAEADVAEAEAKRILAEKMTAYQAARDDYHNKSETLKKVKAKYGIK